MKAFAMAVLCIWLVACDDRSDGLKGFNDPPVIFLQAQKGGEETKLLADSVKTSNPQYDFMPFIIRVADPNQNIKHVSMQMIEGTGALFYQDAQLSDTVRIVGNKGLYRFVPAAVGNTTVRFVVTDYFDKTDSAVLQLYVFDNLAPVASLEVNYIGVADKNEYLLDASLSEDADHSFGGVVTKYIFTVNNVKIAETSTPAIPYIFPVTGTYTCKVKVVDNDGAVSREVSQIVQVP